MKVCIISPFKLPRKFNGPLAYRLALMKTANPITKMLLLPDFETFDLHSSPVMIRMIQECADSGVVRELLPCSLSGWRRRLMTSNPFASSSSKSPQKKEFIRWLQS